MEFRDVVLWLGVLIIAMGSILGGEYITTTHQENMAKLGYEQTRLDGETIWIKRGIME